MAEEFNIKEGIVKSLKTALQNNSFISAVFSMLMGEKGAEKEVEYWLKSAAQENTLNEVVSIHRLYKQTLRENTVVNLVNMPKELIGQLMDIRKKSTRFQRKVLVRTLKKPGMFASFVYVIKALATAGYPIDDILATPQAIKLITELAKTAAEVYKEERKTKSGLDESFDPDTKKWVSLFVGRFQPFTLGHVKCLKKLREAYGAPILICAIPVTEEKADAEHPFYGKLQDEMYERLRNGLNDEFPGLIADITYVPNAYIGNLVDSAKNLGFQPIGWGCGTDRYEIRTPRKRKKKDTDSDFVVSGYKPQTDKYIAQQMELDAEAQNINPDNFNILHIQRDVAGDGDDPVSKISGTKVREAIMNNDKETFANMVPKCLYGLFDDFKIALEEIYGEDQKTRETAPEPAYQAITESKVYEDFRKSLDKGIKKLLR